MTAKIIDGKAVAKEIRSEISARVAELKKKGVTPGLAVILVGENSASQLYVSFKEKACIELGMYSRKINLPITLAEKELLNIIHQLNEDKQIHGILVQLPLPKQIEPNKIIEAISPEKDVDGFHPIDLGRMITGQDAFLSCTPYGVLKLLKFSGIELTGKHAVIVGRSNIVGKPMGQILLNENCTVTFVHSQTRNLKEITQLGDIIIVAIGKQEFIDASYVKPGAIVIDVGINKNESGKTVGDVNFDQVKEIASYITPVPGGVGPMTITMLMRNTVKAAEAIYRKNKVH
jgi:methylenetetrahydrofolate dehydrogenase (NADP+)/methenyltetrahydrofolate cyclohydrolase